MRASPTADRDLALMGLFVALLGVLAAIATALMLGAAVTTSLLGGPWAMPGVDTWLSGVLGVLGHPGSPGAGLGQPWAGALAGQAGWYWTITVVLLVVTTGLVLVVA